MNPTPESADPSNSSSRIAERDEVILSPGAALAAREDVDEENGPIRRRVWLPLMLFLLTMLSTFVAGATNWLPQAYFFVKPDTSPIPFRLTILQHWDDGLIYMACLLGMLLAHEMGHFLATLYYRVPASFPYFLPFPISPLGTLGAVIRMDNRDADRKQMFDIGIAGPLAGLLVALPLLLVGLQRLDLQRPAITPPVHPQHLYKLGMPLGMQMLAKQVAPRGYLGEASIDIRYVNPYLMAGWVGLLVTALNMMPVSQLDGGHVTYTLFGKKAHYIARAFMVTAIAYMVYYESYWMVLMLGIVLLIGVDHPPTSNDRAPLGYFRYVLGVASLAIPVLCLTLEPLIPLFN